MPWKIEQRENEYCVIKEADGAVEGCHETNDKALAQLAALNAAEEKERDIRTKELHYKEVTQDDSVATDEDFVGGCRVCGFGEAEIVKGLSNCPFCWNEVSYG